METTPTKPPGRVPTGIPGMDTLIGGGFLENSLVLLSGETGTGKTIFALQFIQAGIVKFKEPAVYISFTEDKEAIYRHALNLGWDLKQLEDEGRFVFARYEPHEVARVVEEGGGTIRDLIDSLGAKRLVIDSITPYMLAFEDPYKENEAILELFRMLRGWKCTSLMISESKGSMNTAPGGRARVLADAVVNLYYDMEGQARARTLEILKMRDTEHTDRLVPFQLGPGGFEVHAMPSRTR